MTTKQLVLIGVVLAIVAFTSALIGGVAAKGGSLLGGSINHYEAGLWQFGNGFYAGTNQQFAVAASGSTTAPALALSASAGTTTLTGVGRVNGYASSTATPIKYVYTTSGTSSISGAANGVVA